MTRSLLIIGFLLCSTSLLSADDRTGVSQVSAYGYDDCLKIFNNLTSVIICPRVGGRILSYKHQGHESLPLPKGGEGWTYESGKGGGSPIPGRFDIGPETTIPKHPELWQGIWQGEIIADRHVRVVSPHDKATGVQLVRDYKLDSKTSQLECRQTMTNRSKESVEYCYWSRTFALGGGIVVIPLTKPSRFPHQYVMYTPAPVINYLPEDQNIRRRDGFLEILGPPAHPKLGMDTQAGWFAYLMPNDLMFVKQYPRLPGSCLQRSGRVDSVDLVSRSTDGGIGTDWSTREVEAGGIGVVHRDMVSGSAGVPRKRNSSRSESGRVCRQGSDV